MYNLCIYTRTQTHTVKLYTYMIIYPISVVTYIGTITLLNLNRNSILFFNITLFDFGPYFLVHVIPPAIFVDRPYNLANI